MPKIPVFKIVYMLLHILLKCAIMFVYFKNSFVVKLNLCLVFTTKIKQDRLESSDHDISQTLPTVYFKLS